LENPMKTFSLLAATAALALSACNRNKPSDRLDDNQVASTNSNSKIAANAPAKRCASGRTYDLLKHEMFRRAAKLRGKDDAIFDRLSTGAALRVERPVVKSQDEGLGSIACSASVALDLPPGLAVAGGRTSLTADLDYTLQPAADGSGDVVTLTNADAITVPLATLGKSAGETPSAPSQALPIPVPGLPGGAADAPSPPPPTATEIHRNVVLQSPTTRPAVVTVTARPSFACDRARTRGETVVCQEPGLAALDRRMSAQYREAYAGASLEQRDMLRSTAHRFYGFRDNCPDARCIANGYRGRMREIDDIMRDDLAPR
jgi:uncharacterized protein YecT (DUF1311 family)